jgi:hypothetical protein
MAIGLGTTASPTSPRFVAMPDVTPTARAMRLAGAMRAASPIAVMAGASSAALAAELAREATGFIRVTGGLA